MARRAASGSPRTYADDARPRAVGQPRSTGEVPEQRRGDRRRRGWREGGWPKGTRASTPRPGHRTGSARSVRWSGYGKLRSGTSRCGSRRSCTTSTTSTICAGPTHALKREAAPGIDGETWQHYGEALEENLRDLSGRLARGAYRAKPVKRAYIPKADGRQRPLGIPTLEDKLVQRTTVEVLNAIYETDFLGFSYGFRPGRSPHQALDALYAGLLTTEGELGARCRHPWVFRGHRPRVAGEVRRAPDCGPARRATDPEMAQGRRAGGREADMA